MKYMYLSGIVWHNVISAYNDSKRELNNFRSNKSKWCEKHLMAKTIILNNSPSINNENEIDEMAIIKYTINEGTANRFFNSLIWTIHVFTYFIPSILLIKKA